MARAKCEKYMSGQPRVQGTQNALGASFSAVVHLAQTINRRLDALHY
jgi:hypothetical protein